MIIPQIVLRAVSLFGGIAVEKSLNKLMPVSIELLKTDTVATIGTAIIQAAAADAVMTYIENRIVGVLDSIALPAPNLEVVPPAAQPASKPTK